MIYGFLPVIIPLLPVICQVLPVIFGLLQVIFALLRVIWGFLQVIFGFLLVIFTHFFERNRGKRSRIEKSVKNIPGKIGKKGVCNTPLQICGRPQGTAPTDSP